ncbi:MAG: rhodanese-like domain-containing protein [Nanoarchaeota archaeon]|nr:rhodanese-like domain-containing protein [Nanoarchaeota archaeon]
MFNFNPAPILTTEQVQEKINSATIIDVRRDDELEHGMLPNAKQIELQELEQALQLENEEFKTKYDFEKPNKEQELIFYCHAGGRSAKAAKLAMKLGFNAKNFQGSIKAWSLVDENVKDY